MTIDQLLLNSLRPEWSGGEVSAETAYQLATLAGKHHITPFWISKIRQNGLFKRFPAELRGRLDQHAMQTKWHNMFAYKLLGDLVKESAPAPVLLLKGIYLAKFVYPNIGLRGMQDVDILVRREDAERVAANLERMGYTVDPDEREWYWNHHYHWHFEPPTLKHPRIEMHWHVKQPGHPLQFPLDWIWDESRPAQLAGQEIRVMSAEIALLYLAWHSLHHQWQIGIKPLIDVTALVKRESLDWSFVAERAHELGIAKQLALMMQIVADWFDAPFPQAAAELLRPTPFSPELVQTAKQHLLFSVPDEQAQELSVEFAGLWQNGRINWRILGRSLLLPRHQIGPMYDVAPESWRVFLCYPRHAARLVRQHWRTTWRLLRGDAALKGEVEFTEQFLATSSWLQKEK